MKVEKSENFDYYYVKIEGLYDQVEIWHKGGEWKVKPPYVHDGDRKVYRTHHEARTLGRALVMAADWALKQNQKERGAE